MPPVWVTEYGFDPSLGSRLPKAAYQAALVSRAVILDRVNGIERTFWRHNPSGEFDLPLTCADGSAQPGLLAVRTTLESLAGATGVVPLPAPDGIRAFLFQFGGSEDQHKEGAKPQYRLVAWCEKGTPVGLALKTRATSLTAWDLWGNTIDLKPTENIAIFQADDFPHFVDMGELGDVRKLYKSFVQFTVTPLVMHDDQQNKIQLGLFNDQQLIAGPYSCELRFHHWPGGEEISTQKVSLLPFARDEIVRELPVPKGAEKGPVYTIDMDIMMGTRRMGYLTLPVWYEPAITRHSEGEN